MTAASLATDDAYDVDLPDDYELLPNQARELFDRTHPLLYIIGGRGSGKSWVNWLHFFLRTEHATDQVYGLFANTDAQLHNSIVAPITEQLDRAGIKHVFESRAPKSWRRRWRRDGIKVPARRLRNRKLWIWEDGTHIFLASLVNNSYTRAKSLDLAMALLEEVTEPGVLKEAITTIIGAVRCGLGRKRNGSSECQRRKHFHQVIVKGNVPLNDPSHWIYADVEQRTKRERARRAAGKPPYFRMINSATQENPHTGEDYIERLSAAMDEQTFEQQTSGRLVRNAAATSYYAFSERNILGTLTYDPNRPLHIWFDFNTTPATAGWGHDLRYDEVPSPEHREGFDYFGIVGELFSGPEPMQTDQVAYALIEDPSKELPFSEARCVDCNCWLRDHVELDEEVGWLCRRCAHQDGERYCSGRPASIDERVAPGARRFIHAPMNWRGLARHRADIYVYADATGKATHADAVKRGGSRQILKDIFTEHLGDRVHFRIPEANPGVKLRVLSMNRMFLAANGVRRLFVAPWCEAHIADFRQVVPHPKTGEPLKVAKTPNSKSDYWLRTDSSDGAGYHVAYRWPAIIPKSNIPDRGGDVELGPMETWWPSPR